MKCSIWWCENKYYAKSFCHAHWLAQKRYGSPYGRHKETFEKIQEVIYKSKGVAFYLAVNDVGYNHVPSSIIKDAYSILESTRCI
jgi:hypothetical protein